MAPEMYPRFTDCPQAGFVKNVERTTKRILKVSSLV